LEYWIAAAAQLGLLVIDSKYKVSTRYKGAFENVKKVLIVTEMDTDMNL
tara:strand:- start:4 stop:150 length:147 start_codon:yes stop_codon:yes gene_type:complete